MTDELDIHAASADEIVAAHHNTFDIWNQGRNLEDHIQHRLRSPTHRAAEWFVGVAGGQVVTSLAAHPVQFLVERETIPGIAIGSVYTVPRARGQAYAPELIGWVEAHKRQQGAGMSVLYSDIKPDYYARLGYVLCPSWEGYREVQGEWPGPAPTHRLVPFAINERLPLVKQTYAAYHGAMPLSIARNDAYWSMMLEKFSADTFHALEDAGGSWAGYVLVGQRGETWRIVDYALIDQSGVLAEQLIRALDVAARAAGASRFGGWLPDIAATRAHFELQPRQAEITMVKPLAWNGTLSPEMVASVGRFCELDHV